MAHDAETRWRYQSESATYDLTRGASSDILDPILGVVGDLRRKRLFDVGGGTGNYALAFAHVGASAVVVDLSRPMLMRASAKGLMVCAAAATRLPFAEASADAITMISMLHLVQDWRAALSEAKRVLKRGGHLILMVYLREDLAGSWIMRYFPYFGEIFLKEHQTHADIADELRGAKWLRVDFKDMQDASIAAMSKDPQIVLQAAVRIGTSFFRRLEYLFPNELRTGLQKLKRDLRTGIGPRDPKEMHVPGRICVWTK